VPGAPKHRGADRGEALKLIIQIPCYNEEAGLADTLAALPRRIEGFRCVEVLVIDDGSGDRTVEVARGAGADHVLTLHGHRGLAKAFMAGLDACISLGADVIVNTDADNQYEAADIQRLVQPILEQRADIVIGARPIGQIEHFSPVKRLLQRLGSHVARTLSNTDVGDAPSGFRAMTADAAGRLNVFNGYTYTLETIIQAGRCHLRVVTVPVRVNSPRRPSRLIKSVGQYVAHSIITMTSAYLVYCPTKFFGMLSALFFLPSAALAMRYLYLALVAGAGRGHVQSVIASGVLAICGTFSLAIGVVAHLLAINRRLIEEVRFMARARGNLPLAGVIHSLSASDALPDGRAPLSPPGLHELLPEREGAPIEPAATDRLPVDSNRR